MSRSGQTSKNWMISRQGSQRNMLRDDAIFDISFKQLGQSGFMTALEIQLLEYSVRSEGFLRATQKSANRASNSSGKQILTAAL